MTFTPFKLERYFARYEFNVRYLLCSSDPETFSIDELLSLDNASSAEKAFKTLRLGYTETLGHPALREALTGLYNNISPSQILCCGGGEEAIYLFMRAILQPGDHVIAHFPAYQSLYQVAQMNGCQVTRWYTRPEDNWELDLEALKQAIQPNTRAIIMNCPHNPTGYLMSTEKLRGIIDIARQHDLYVFSDEVYRFLEHQPSQRLPAACDLYEKAVSIGAMSKAFALPGLRLGWLATQDAQTYQKLASYKDYTSICNSAPSELLATLAIQQRDKIFARLTALIQTNLALANSFFARQAHLFDWQAPQAGVISFVQLKDSLPNAMTAEAFCDRVVEQAGILLLPSIYYDYGNAHFRFGFGRQNFAEALEAFEDFLVKDFAPHEPQPSAV